MAFLRTYFPNPRLLVLLLTDALALQCAALLAFGLRSLIGPLENDLYLTTALILLLGPVFSIALGTCQSIALPPHKEVKQLFLVATLTYLVVLASLFLAKDGAAYSRTVMLGAWLCSVFMLPLFRGTVRRMLCRAPWWGRALIFLQQGQQTDALWESLSRHPERGLRPVAALDCTGPDVRTLIDKALNTYPNAMGLLFMNAHTDYTSDIIRMAAQRFKRLLLVPVMTTDEHRFWFSPRDLESVVGLLVRQNLRDAPRLRAKRAIDLVLTVCAGIVALPLGLALALWIRLDSQGPALYTHERMGQGGKPFYVYKFRTMVYNADATLNAYLLKNPELRAEWEAYQKLRNDPRITRAGAFLRKTSLDELPQLLNVLMGSMSLVGPRPIVKDEVVKYGSVYSQYILVKPGITGVWQVSGRNNTTYAARVAMDHYYVNNWSVWMDVWILARTIPVVILGKGAY